MDVNPKLIEDWNSRDILEWICVEYSKANRSYEHLALQKFRTVTINEFRHMTVLDFLKKLQNQEDANFLYSCKEQLFATCLDRKSKKLENWTNADLMDWICESYVQQNVDYEKVPLQNFRGVDITYFKQMSLKDLYQRLGVWSYAEILYQCKTALFNSSVSNTSVPPCHQTCGSSEENNSSYDKVVSNRQTTTNSYLNESNTETIRVRKRGRPRIKQQVKNKEPRHGKLWEFLKKLLMDSKTCPSLIKWEDYNEGTFKFVQNEKVAKMWGERKKNSKMTYEKFSRAMRYYYRNQILQPVSGKRLVYKFGPKATGWQNMKPIGI